MRIKTIVGVALAALCLSAAGVIAPAASATHQSWAPADEATIHPGVMTYTAGAQCTANFVFTSGSEVFLGQAAHCSSTGAQTDTNGCLAESLPIGTPVEIDGATRPGSLVYNSWLTMQDVGETDTNACNYNDFALVRIDPADHGRVNPSIPVWGGPVGLGGATAALEGVYSFGNSSLRLGLEPLSPKLGWSLGTTGAGWSHPVYTVTAGIPGDSGSAFLDSQGRAIGVLSTLALAPLAGSNNVSDLASALSYMAQHDGLNAQLELGTEAFDGSPTGLLGGLVG